MNAPGSINRVRHWWQRHFGLPGLPRAQSELSEWFRTPLGASLLAQQRRQLDAALQDRFGYHLLQMSITPQVDITGGSRIAHRVTVGQRVGHWQPLSGLVADYSQLPLPDASVDVVILHHLLDYSDNPQQVLREVERVLIPRGHLMVLGFNPRSGLGGTRALVRLFSRNALWHYRALRLGRLLDWLPLLNLAPDRVQHGFLRPPINSPGLLRRLEWLETWGERFHLPGGAFYMVTACKEVGGAVPVKPPWENLSEPLGNLQGAQPLRNTKKPYRTMH